MSDLDLYTGAGSLLRDARRASRAISRVQAGGQVRQAQVDVDADVAMGKLDALTAATGQAMGQVAKVGMAEQQLAQLAPMASGRLSFIADRHMLAAADVLDDLRHELRRR
jgi:hypothetical protein